MASKLTNTLSIAVGAALLGSVSIASASSAFQLNDLQAGYSQVGDAAKAPDSKCGTGSCGGNKGKKCMDMKEKADQDKCMADAHKTKEGSCSADGKKKEGSCSADGKKKEGSCSADGKKKEGSCSADGKKKEASCSGKH